MDVAYQAGREGLAYAGRPGHPRGGDGAAARRPACPAPAVSGGGGLEPVEIPHHACGPGSAMVVGSSGGGHSAQWDEHARAGAAEPRERRAEPAEQPVGNGTRPLSGGQGSLRGPRAHPVHASANTACRVRTAWMYPGISSCTTRRSCTGTWLGPGVRIASSSPRRSTPTGVWPAANASRNARSTSPSANGSPRWIPCWAKRPTADLVRNPPIRVSSGRQTCCLPGGCDRTRPRPRPRFSF